MKSIVLASLQYPNIYFLLCKKYILKFKKFNFKGGRRTAVIEVDKREVFLYREKAVCIMTIHDNTKTDSNLLHLSLNTAISVETWLRPSKENKYICLFL